MESSTSILTLPLDHGTVLSNLTKRLVAQGMQVFRSFDLQAARSAHSECTCPYHGTVRCDCQMVILLIYHGKNAPVTLIAHSRDGETRFAWGEMLAIRDAKAKDLIVKVLSTENIAVQS